MSDFKNVLALIDVSGSISSDDLNYFNSKVEEILIRTSKDVFVTSTACVKDGAFFKIGVDDIESLKDLTHPIFSDNFMGRGTDVGKSIQSAIALDIVKNEEIDALIFFTDFLDHIPKDIDNSNLDVVYVSSLDEPIDFESLGLSNPKKRALYSQKDVEGNLDANSVSKNKP